MLSEDKPIERQEGGVSDQPIQALNVQDAGGVERDSFLSTQAAFLDSYVTGNNPLENYYYYSQVFDKAAQVRKLAAQKAEADTVAIKEEFISNPYGPTGSIEETANAVHQANLQAMQGAVDPDRQYVEAIAGDNAPVEEINRWAARTKMYGIIADWQEEVGASDVIMDVVKSVIPFYTSTKGYQLTGRYFGQDAEIQKAIRSFRLMSDEDKAEIFPVIAQELRETLGDVAGLEIASAFLGTWGAEESNRYDDLNRAFDFLDVAGVATLIGPILRTVKQGTSTVRTMKSLGNEVGATDVTIASLADPDIARATGRSSEGAMSDALPFDTSIETLRVEGLSGRVLEDLDGYFGRVDKTAEDIMLGRGFLREGIVSDVRRAEVEAEAIHRLRAEKAEDIRITAQDPEGTTFSYQVRDPDFDTMVEETYRMHLTLNDAGQWEQSSASLLGNWLGSPSAFARGMLKQDVSTAQRVDYLSARINNQLFQHMRDAIKPIGLTPTPKNRASLARVDNALIQGDEWKNADGSRGRVFKPDELRAQFGLEDNEVSAYYRLNRLYNNIFHLRNAEKRAEFQRLNYRNVNIPDKGEMTMGKPFATQNDASSSLRQNNTNFVYDIDNDTLLFVRDDLDNFLTTTYNDQRQVVRLSEAYDPGQGRDLVNYVVSSQRNITDLPEMVLRRKEGYVPRIYQDNVYFVKEISHRVVDGDKSLRQPKTLRFFDNKKDADTYRQSLITRAMADGMSESDAVAKYVRLSDREEEILSASLGEVGHGSGGLYTGARSQDDILFGLEGTKPLRLNSFESLTRNIGNLSRFVAMNQWRMGLEERWKNSVNAMYRAKGLDNRVEHFARLSPDSEAVDEVRFFNRMYDQIRDWQHFPTTEERAWTASVQRVYDWAADRGYRSTARLVGNLRGVDPIATARATAFHSLLGWYNPAQLWVQAQGAMVAASLGAGKYLTRTLLDTTALSSLDTAGQHAGSIMGRMAKARGISEDEMRAYYALWEKTGYKDSVLQTADHAAASRGYGMSQELLRRAADNGLIMYRMGELTNRRLSFATAVERYKERTGITSVSSIDDAGLRAIMDDANNMLLNMTRANRAQWQKGFLSLPTQFLQVTTKFLETAGGFNKQFTAAERGRLVASQFLLYGTAGVPMVGYSTKIIAQMFGLTQQDIENNPGLVKTINDGFWGATSYWVFGADIELASRGSLLRGVGDFIDNWFIQESTIAEKLLGAFGSTGTRFWDSFTHRIKPFTLGGMGEVDWQDAAALVTMPFFESLSSWNNAEKAMYMQRLNTVYSRAGRPIDTHDFSFGDIVGQAIGFQPSRLSETWDIVQRNRAAQAMQKNITDYILVKMNEFAFRHPQGDYTPDQFEAHQRDIQAALAVLDPDEVLQVTRSIHNIVTSGSRRAEAIDQYLNNLKTSTVEDIEGWKATLTGNRVLRLGLETEGN